MIRRLFERMLLGPGPGIGHQAYDLDAEDGEQPEVSELEWLRHRNGELERALSDRGEAATTPLPLDGIAAAAELGARNTDLIAELGQTRKELATTEDALARPVDEPADTTRMEKR